VRRARLTRHRCHKEGAEHDKRNQTGHLIGKPLLVAEEKEDKHHRGTQQMLVGVLLQQTYLRKQLRQQLDTASEQRGPLVGGRKRARLMAHPDAIRLCAVAVHLEGPWDVPQEAEGRPKAQQSPLPERMLAVRAPLSSDWRGPAPAGRGTTCLHQHSPPGSPRTLPEEREAA
jgi:hypothetical protein